MHATDIYAPHPTHHANRIFALMTVSYPIHTTLHAYNRNYMHVMLKMNMYSVGYDNGRRRGETMSQHTVHLPLIYLTIMLCVYCKKNIRICFIQHIVHCIGDGNYMNVMLKMIILYSVVYGYAR